MKYIDAHSHWTKFSWTESSNEVDCEMNSQNFESKLQSCSDKNINFFLQGGIDPVDWLRQISIKNKYPENFGLCFGLHPYYVSEHAVEDCEAALDQLAQLLPQAMALGEAGLDFRPHIMKESEGLQIEMFENQIALAKAFKKPMVLHIVQAYGRAIQIFDIWQRPPQLGFVHAFNGSFEVAKKFIDRGFLISVGGAVTHEKNRKLQDCIKKLPLEYLLIESDSPDQSPAGWVGGNESTSIYNVAEKIAFIKNTNLFEILDINTSNFKRLFRL